ncbi:MAG: lytic transglycosylase domain-containing protein [Stappiaceae bacterium]
MPYEMPPARTAQEGVAFTQLPDWVVIMYFRVLSKSGKVLSGTGKVLIACAIATVSVSPAAQAYKPKPKPGVASSPPVVYAQYGTPVPRGKPAGSVNTATAASTQPLSLLPGDHSSASAPSSAVNSRLANTQLAIAAAPAIKKLPVIRNGTSAPGSSGSVKQLKAGLDALDKGRVGDAFAIRKAMRPSLDRRIMDWRLITSAPTAVSYDFVTNFAKDAPHWPTDELVRSRAEAALSRARPDPQTVLRVFTQNPPQTTTGKLLQAKSLKAVGRTKEAKALVRNIYRTKRMSSGLEKQIRRDYGSYLTNSDHLHRVDMYLFEDRINDAKRTLPLLTGNQKAYFNARSAVIRKKSSAKKLLADVPRSMRKHPGYIFAKIQHLRRTKNPRDAAKLMASAPTDPRVLVDRDEWWVERRLTSRNILDVGDSKTAYRIAANHAAESPAKYAEAEFHAGWYALRFLKAPRKAEPHFRNILKVATLPATISRAYYWLGRTEEARGRKRQAADYYEKAGAHGTAYHGQLARARMGKRTVGLARYPSPTREDRRAFKADERVQAIERLMKAKHPNKTGQLYRQLALSLPSAGQVALLTEMAEKQGQHQLALMVGKTAIKNNPKTASLAFPISAIPKGVKISKGVGKPMVYAIARQESAFNPAAKSHAGALGLLQLMPATAKRTAKDIGASYSKGRLTSDPTYNATLGAAHLGVLVDSFGGSYIMTFAGYNAGAGRVKQWVERYGDPRNPKVDPVDWIERIPFTETRNYVQKITENLQVYRERLDGKGLNIEKDLRRGG